MSDAISVNAVDEIPLDQADIVIRPLDPNLGRMFGEFYSHRAVFRSLIHRELRRQFLELKLGFLWIFARPLLMTAIFILLKRGADAQVLINVPYPVFAFAGLLFWFTTIDAVNGTASVTHTDAAIMSKIYYPRLFSPLAQAIVGVLKMAVGFVPLAGFLLYHDLLPGWSVLLVPLVLAHATVLAFAVGTCFALLATHSRDWERALSLLLYIGLFLSPVLYPVAMVRESWRTLYALNPMVGLIETFRSAAIAGYPSHGGDWAISAAVTTVAALCALFAFNKAEARMLDQI